MISPPFTLSDLGARIVFEERSPPRRLLWKTEPGTFDIAVIIPARRLQAAVPEYELARATVDFVIRGPGGEQDPAFRLRIGELADRRYLMERREASQSDPFAEGVHLPILGAVFLARGLPQSVNGLHARGAEFTAALRLDDRLYGQTRGIVGQAPFLWLRRLTG